jgi:hypothetical protein
VGMPASAVTLADESKGSASAAGRVLLACIKK